MGVTRYYGGIGVRLTDSMNGARLDDALDSVFVADKSGTVVGELRSKPYRDVLCSSGARPIFGWFGRRFSRERGHLDMSVGDAAGKAIDMIRSAHEEL